MSDLQLPAHPDGQPPYQPPKVTILMLATFADLYRQEVAAEEVVHRTLPFFGTALSIVIGALAYAAGRLPKWTDLTTHRAMALFAASTVLLSLAIIEAGCVLIFISRAIARRDYRRIGPETALRTRLDELRAYYDGQGMHAALQDAELVKDAISASRILHDGHSDQPCAKPASLAVPLGCIVPPRSQLDLGARSNHCHIRD